MKHLSIILTLLVSLFVACQSNSTCDVTPSSVTTLSVALSNTSRTSLGDKVGDNYPVYWTEEDNIVVNGVKSSAISINSQDNTRAIFSFGATIDLPYYITHPYTEGTTAKDAKVAFPAEQSYVEGSFDKGCAPMCGYVAESSDNISLKHLSGILRIAIRAKEGVATTLKMVEITSDKPLAGTFAVNCQSATITPTSDCSNAITYTLPANFALSESADSHLYIAVPSGDIGNCKFTFHDTKGNTMVATWNGASVKAGVVREFKSFAFDKKDKGTMLESMYESEGEWVNDQTTVRGFIRCAGRPISGVVVSDGILCTKTDNVGYFALNSDLTNAKFIMVSIPSGYTAPTDANGLPIFYHRVSDNERNVNYCEVNFSFNKITNNADRYTLLVGADPQPRAKTAGYDRNAYHSLDCCEDLYRDMREKAATITDRNVYGLMLGDIVHEDMSLYDNYIAGLSTLKFPMFNILGNHDNDTTAENDAEGRRVFEAKLGPTYYSFNIGKLHYVVLDNLIMKKADNGELTDYDNGLTDEIWEWLQNDLSYVDRSSTIMVAAHSAMFKLITGGNRGAAHKNDYGYLFAEFAKAHVWTGHQHTTYNYNYSASSAWGAIEEHTVARSTGELWTNEYMTGGTPRGYTVVEVDGDNVSWYFKPTIYQSGAFTASKYTSKQPSYTYRDWNYVNGVAKMKKDGSTLSESYQMKVYKPRQYHASYEDMLLGAEPINYVYVNVFLWDNKWEYPKYNGVKMEKIGYEPAYCLATYEIRNHYYSYGYKLTNHDSYGPSNNNIHTIFRAPESRATGTGTVTVVDRFGNNYSSSVSW